jgi:hypothetical protein
MRPRFASPPRKRGARFALSETAKSAEHEFLRRFRARSPRAVLLRIAQDKTFGGALWSASMRIL